MMSPNEEPSQLMMMTTENVFEIDKEFLRNEAKSLKHAEKSKWFFSTLTKEQKEKFKDQWYISNDGNNGNEYSIVYIFRYLCCK